MEKISFFLLLYLGLAVLGCRGIGNKERPGTATRQDTTFRILVVEQGRGQVKLFHRDGHLADSAMVGYNPHEITTDPRQERIYVSNFGVEDYDNTLGIPGTTLSVFEPKDLSKVQNWPTYRAHGYVPDTCKAPHGIKLRPGKKELFVNVEYGDSMLVYDTQNGRIARAFAVAKGTHNFEFSLSGDTIWSIAGNNGLFRYEASTGQETGHFPTTTALRGLTFTENRKTLILSCWNEVYLLNAKDLSIQKHFTDLGVKQIIYSCLGPDERQLFAPCPYDNLVLVLDLETGKAVRRIACGKAPIYVRVAPNGTEAFVANALDDHMSIIDLTDFSVRRFGNIFKPNGFLFLNP